mmetsp:Transcript_8899/g.36775  ORF Transcript_8899/g.36775 Transcript_8899/m.36775 type:complete len:242 (-) Transcript_8899:63-788(-)
MAACGESNVFSHITSLEELTAAFEEITSRRNPTQSEVKAHKAHRRVLKNRLSACRSRERKKARDRSFKNDREMLLKENAQLKEKLRRLEAKLRRWEGGNATEADVQACLQSCSFPDCFAYCKEDHTMWSGLLAKSHAEHDCGGHGQQAVCGAPCDLNCEDRCPIPVEIAHDTHLCRAPPPPCPSSCSASSCDQLCFEEDHLHVMAALGEPMQVSQQTVDELAALEGSAVGHICQDHLQQFL